jgi:1,2-phenylacetyl-CoA epoxidase PaaB subunit
MSKIRQHIPMSEGDLESPEEGDLAPFVIFTQLVEGGPFLFAGWLDATDETLALTFAREHYGQDQKCVHLWAIPRDAIRGTDRPAVGSAGPSGRYVVLVQPTDADLLASREVVEAADGGAALDAARALFETPQRRIWVVPETRIAATGDADLIWRYTDQSYRLARGYSKEVREKWERVREERALEEYERDDLQEAF